MLKITCNLFLAFLMPWQALSAQIEFAEKGQISSWATITRDVTDIGLRYIPTINLGYPLGENWSIDGELALNSFAARSFFENGQNLSTNATQTYRAWLRLNSNQFEIRLGLQKINFGPALLLRSLIWFDEIDPRDPLQLTAGVRAILARYYFLNNTNLWFWLLYGNENRRGIDIFSSEKNRPEVGGRLQFPFLNGELGFSVLQRHARQSNNIQPGFQPIPTNFSESRFGFDGRWDFFCGLWFESVVLMRDSQASGLKDERRITLGADYTLAIGPGITLLAEYFHREFVTIHPQINVDQNFYALSARAPVGLLDHFNGMLYFNPEENLWFRFFNWQRSYNNWQFNFIAFWNPKSAGIFDVKKSNSFAGKGGQLMLIFNH